MEQLASLVASLATLVAAIVAVILGLMNRKKIQTFQISIDGRMDQLLTSHGKEMKAEGIQQERDRNTEGPSLGG